MTRRIRKSSRNIREKFGDQHRFEHWYVDNQVYFITARCRDRFPAFTSEEAKAIFWDRFDHYSKNFGYVPWITTLLDNHYHTLGYLKKGTNLKFFMQRVHGSVAKLVNDRLDERLIDFWRDSKGKEYFDGCIRDELQCRRAYRYTLTQSRRHGIMQAYWSYPHTHKHIELDVGVKRALELAAFLEDVPYKRYEHRNESRRSGTRRLIVILRSTASRAPHRAVGLQSRTIRQKTPGPFASTGHAPSVCPQASTRRNPLSPSSARRSG